MSIRNKNDIRVYSELPFQINLVGQHKEYVFPPCVDGEPTMNFVDWSDIEYANSRGNVFSSGLLIFEESEMDEIYQELRIKDWKKKVWFDRDIVDAIENPTLEKMQRIIDVKDLLTLERIRGKAVYYTNHNMNISQKVLNIINARYREITTGVLGSKIVIQPTDIEPTVSADEVNALKKQIAEMQKMMEKMAIVSENSSSVDEVEEAKPAPKKSGRKAANKK